MNVNSDLGVLLLVPVVAPSDIGGGGGTSRELTITWTVGLANTFSRVTYDHELNFPPKSDLTTARSKPMETSISRSFCTCKVHLVFAFLFLLFARQCKTAMKVRWLYSWRKREENTSHHSTFVTVRFDG